MASWNENPAWINAQNINNGKQYTSADGVTYTDFNAIVQNLLHLKANIPKQEVRMIDAQHAPYAIVAQNAQKYYITNATYLSVSLPSEDTFAVEITVDFSANGDATLLLSGVTNIYGVNPADAQPGDSWHILITENGAFCQADTKHPARYYEITIPAATATDLKGWYYNGNMGYYELQIYDVAWMTEDLFIELKCENPDIFTEHNFRLYPDDGFLDLSIDSFPERATIVYVVVPNMAYGGNLNGGES